MAEVMHQRSWRYVPEQVVERISQAIYDLLYRNLPKLENPDPQAGFFFAILGFSVKCTILYNKLRQKRLI